MMRHKFGERWGGWFALAMPKDRVDVNGKQVTITEPTLLSRIGNSIRLNKQTFEPVTLPSADVIAGVVTDRKVYRPDDLVYAFVALPYLPGEQVKLELLYLDRPLLTETLTLDKHGVALTTFEGLEIGSHTLRLTSSDGRRFGETAFEVAEFALAPLTVRLTSVRWEKERYLHLQGQVLRLDEPYSGRLKVELLTRYFGDWEPLFGTEMPCGDGTLSLRFWMRWWESQLALRVQTPDGETALVPIPFTDWRSRYEIILSEMGRIWKAQTTPKPEAKAAHGVFIWSEGRSQYVPVCLQNAVASEAIFTLQRELSHLVIVAFDSVHQRQQVHQWRNLKAGETVNVPIVKPFTLLLVGALEGDGWFEGEAVVVHPDQLSLKVQAPEQTRPGQTLTVTLKANKPCRCFLVVHDARLPYERMEQKMSEQMITALRNTPWASWRWREWREWDLWERRRFFLGRAAMVKARASAPMLAAPAEPLALYSVSPEEAVTEAPAAEPELPRGYFPEVVYCGLVDLDGEAEVNFVIGEQIGEWVVRAFAVADGDWMHTEQTLTVSKPAYLEADLPAIASEDDETLVRILYRTPQPSRIVVTTPTERVEQLVEASGELFVPFKGYGKVAGELVGVNDPSIADAFEREVTKAGVARVLSSSLHWLFAGEVLEGETVTVYPSPLHLVETLVWSLVGYPFG